ncbi:hypothetical protein [Piscinibacter koreensis]|uniref:Uncharacterized protein n=1 Tax=Piscinibacter koreensis TaxID=2742824 RepID=A0A7Y6NPL7_9BURK|nr:hypothetical protein [Schlegelella koreensis]NUZ06907.1 hypothetical protein [Schlegelella koreensis]
MPHPAGALGWERAAPSPSSKPRFAADLSLLFTEVPFLARFVVRRRRASTRSSSCSLPDAATR